MGCTDKIERKTFFKNHEKKVPVNNFLFKGGLMFKCNGME